MKKILMGLCLLVATSPAMAGETASCGAMEQVREKARQNLEDVSQQVHDDYVVEKGEDFWDDCIGGILDGGGGFGLSLPSVGSMVQKACSYARDSAEAQLRQASQNFSYDFGYGASASAEGAATGGGGFTGVEVTDSSKTLADSVWEALK